MLYATATTLAAQAEIAPTSHEPSSISIAVRAGAFSIAVASIVAMTPFSERSIPEVIFSTPAAVFYCAFAEELFRASGSPKGWPALAALAAALVLRSTVALWISIDAQESGAQAPYDLGGFVFFVPLVALVYLFVRRGWKGFVPLSWYIFLVLTGGLCGWLPSLIAFVINGRFQT